MKQALKELLDQLDELFEEHRELGDTDVRERMSEAVYKSFIAPRSGYTLPGKFGMPSRAGDQKVRAAIETFLNHPEVPVAAQSLEPGAARLAWFQDGTVRSAKGRTFDEYFGAFRESGHNETPENPPVVNLTVLRRTRNTPKPGDIFVMLPPDELYLYGRVIITDADAGFGPCNLIYIYRPRTTEKRSVPELPREELLIPPIMTNRSPWAMGYFEFLENRPLTSDDRFPRHCFQDTYGRYHDDHCNKLAEPTEPIGLWGLFSIRGIAKEISKALGIPIPPD